MKGSARNQLAGNIQSINSQGLLAELVIDCGAGFTLLAQISQNALSRLKLTVGSPVVALIKSSSITIATDLAPMQLSAENCLNGTIERVEKGAVNNVVTLKLESGHNLTATITLYSSETLALDVGHAATAVFNANQVLLGVLS